jgi:hypothetical protein
MSDMSRSARDVMEIRKARDVDGNIDVTCFFRGITV